VALKIIADDLGDFDDFDETEANYVERFKNEARAMARVSHPGIVAVYDFGETKVGRFVPAAPSGERRAEDSPPYQSPPHHGLLYIAMEYVEGTDVARMLEQQERLQPKHALAITAQVCAALACAHERGIIHRDIKPANILIDPDDVVKVADFGLAKLHGSDGQTLGLTQSGIAMGTLHYMAPESMILGTAVDHRADIYAVGVMLYQMITGKVPHGMFRPPSKQVPGLDPRYDAMITKAMRADRDRRYQSIQELHRDLCDILTGGTLKVESATTPTPAPSAQPSQALQQVLAKLNSRLSRSLAKLRPLARHAAIMAGVVLVVVTIAFVGYAAVTVSDKIWPRQSAKPQAIPKPTLATTPAQPPIVLPQPVSQPPPAPAAPAATIPTKTATPPRASTPPAITVPTTPAANKYHEWTDAEGFKFQAVLVQLLNGQALFKGVERSFSTPLSRLSVESQEQASQLAQGRLPVATAAMTSPAVLAPPPAAPLKSPKTATPPRASTPPAITAPTTPAANKYHEWTDAEGFKFQAVLVQLLNGQALFKGVERSFSTPLSRLSAESQEQASQLAQGRLPVAATAMTSPAAPPPQPAAPLKSPNSSTKKTPAPALKDDPRLAKLEADFDRFWQEEMQQPYLAELKDLRKRYVELGLIPARDDALKSGRKSEASNDLRHDEGLAILVLEHGVGGVVIDEALVVLPSIFSTGPRVSLSLLRSTSFFARCSFMRSKVSAAKLVALDLSRMASGCFLRRGDG
jgi:serine/threonine protein kinase